MILRLKSSNGAKYSRLSLMNNISSIQLNQPLHNTVWKNLVKFRIARHRLTRRGRCAGKAEMKPSTTVITTHRQNSWTRNNIISKKSYLEGTICI